MIHGMGMNGEIDQIDFETLVYKKCPTCLVYKKCPTCHGDVLKSKHSFCPECGYAGRVLSKFGEELRLFVMDILIALKS